MSEVEAVAEEEKTALAARGYVVMKTMGSGSYSTVKKCKVLETAAVAATTGAPKAVAIKIIDRNKASSRFLTIFLPRELSISAGHSHINIASTLEHFTVGPRTFVVMQLAARGDLEQYISLRGALVDKSQDHDLPHHVTRQTLLGVQYLHNRNIIHRDLKCENLFLDWKNVVKIGDFGFSRVMGPEDQSTTFCGSRAYVAPELLQQQPYKGKPADSWSLGVILFIMLEARMPFDDRDPPRMLRNQLQKRVPFTPKTKPLARDLILALLEPNIERRLNATTAQEHRWFSTATPSPSNSPSNAASGSASPSSAASPSSTNSTTASNTNDDAASKNPVVNVSSSNDENKASPVVVQVASSPVAPRHITLAPTANDTPDSES